MPKFNIGDKVKVTHHRREEYIGTEGTVAEVNPNTPTVNTRAVPSSGELPPLGRKTTYDVAIENPPYQLSRVEEDWLELLPNREEDQQDDEGSC